MARDHWVEVELGDDVPRDRPLRLVAHGWIHPTDSSINVAIGQGGQVKPQGLVLEVPAADGDWTVARADLGFPAGKNKTILIDLDGIFPPSGPRRFRLRTNLEVFWDSLAVAVAVPETPLKTQRLAPRSAELRPRGYSLMTQADASSPELPHYDTLVGTGQRWRDLIGFYTRFGDVRELLEAVDDRYVIANAGDELALRFPAPPPPPDGLGPRFRHDRRRLEQGRRLQHGVLQDRAPAAVARAAGLRRAPGRAGGRPGVSLPSGGLAGVSYTLRHTE